jgi:hypothetical protein
MYLPSAHAGEQKPTVREALIVATCCWLKLYGAEKGGKMRLPSFRAEASLFATRGLYRGSNVGGRAVATAVLPQDCSSDCSLTYSLCLAGAAVSGNPFALAGCFLAETSCLAKCSGDGGGLGGWPTPCCPPGEKCCGQCRTIVANNRHYPYCQPDGMCVPLHEACPKRG